MCRVQNIYTYIFYKTLSREPKHHALTAATWTWRLIRADQFVESYFLH